MFRWTRGDYARVVFIFHARLRVHWASGIPHALSWAEVFPGTTRAKSAAGMRTRIRLEPRHCEEHLRRSNPLFRSCWSMDCFACARNDVWRARAFDCLKFVPSFRGDAQHRTRNLEIPRCAIAHLRSGANAPSRNDGLFCNHQPKCPAAPYARHRCAIWTSRDDALVFYPTG